MLELQQASSHQINELHEGGYQRESRREINILENLLNFTSSYGKGFGLPSDLNIKSDVLKDTKYK